jgi:hypothetical protein
MPELERLDAIKNGRALCQGYSEGRFRSDDLRASFPRPGQPHWSETDTLVREGIATLGHSLRASTAPLRRERPCREGLTPGYTQRNRGLGRDCGFRSTRITGTSFRLMTLGWASTSGPSSFGIVETLA